MAVTVLQPPTVGVPAYVGTMACEAESAGRARKLVTYALGEWGLGGLTETASLCVTELVANAVQHSGARTIRVAVSRTTDHRVRIEVTEEDRTLPIRRHPGPYEQRGRGLMLIDALSELWGADLMRWGKAVWCEFDTTRDRVLAASPEKGGLRVEG